MAEQTTLIEPLGVDIDLESGVLENPSNRTVRRASDMRGYYGDEAALERLIRDYDDPLHYEVEEKPVPEEYGHLMYCISRLQPGSVGGECFMTKGHFHTIVNTAETYLCLRGSGYMVMKTEDGAFRAEPMWRGRMVYVPPYWAHRSVNTGDDVLVSYCVYPADAGHNYGDIREQGFLKRVMKDADGQVAIRD